MLQCWNHSPALRPTFFDIVFKLDRILASSGSEVRLLVNNSMLYETLYVHVAYINIYKGKAAFHFGRPSDMHRGSCRQTCPMVLIQLTADTS